MSPSPANSDDTASANRLDDLAEIPIWFLVWITAALDVTSRLVTGRAFEADSTIALLALGGIPVYVFVMVRRYLAADRGEEHTSDEQDFR